MQAGQQCTGERDEPVDGAGEWPAGPALAHRRAVLEGTPHLMHPFGLPRVIPHPRLNVELTECLTLAREPFVAFLERHPALMQHMITVLSGYIRRLDDTCTEAAFLDIPGRVAKKLLDLAEQHGENTPDGIRIRMRLSQRTLAGMVAASRENVNRALARFLAHGDIQHEGGYITIRRPAELRKRS